MHNLSVALVSLCLLSSGCSGGNDGGSFGGDGGVANEGGSPTGSSSSCAARTARLVGNVDGTSVDESYESNGYALVLENFTGTIGSRGKVELVLAAAGNTNVVSGKVTFPTTGALAGKTVCVGGGTLSRGTGYAFTLNNLSSFDNGTCGAAISGAIQGCVGAGK